MIRHKLVDMAMQINACRAVLDPATLCMEFCAREAVQILGGAGFIRGWAEEILRDLAARQMGW